MAAKTEIDQGDYECENSDDERQQSVEVRYTSFYLYFFSSSPPPPPPLPPSRLRSITQIHLMVYYMT